MSKHDDYIWGRQSGLELALRIVKEDGIEGLEKEIRYRGRTGINSNLTVKELTKLKGPMCDRVAYSVLLLTFCALSDLYGFGRTRLERLYDKINEGSELIIEDLATFDDYAQALKEAHGIEIDWSGRKIDWN